MSPFSKGETGLRGWCISMKHYYPIYKRRVIHPGYGRVVPVSNSLGASRRP